MENDDKKSCEPRSPTPPIYTDLTTMQSPSFGTPKRAIPICEAPKQIVPIYEAPKPTEPVYGTSIQTVYGSMQHHQMSGYQTQTGQFLHPHQSSLSLCEMSNQQPSCISVSPQYQNIQYQQHNVSSLNQQPFMQQPVSAQIQEQNESVQKGPSCSFVSRKLVDILI